MTAKAALMKDVEVESSALLLRIQLAHNKAQKQWARFVLVGSIHRRITLSIIALSFIDEYKLSSFIDEYELTAI